MEKEIETQKVYTNQRCTEQINSGFGWNNSYFRALKWMALRIF